jgi:hypothetical protein
MKKLLTIAALVGATSLSFGQGYVAFNNTSGTRFSTNGLNPTAGTGFGTAALAGRYYFELFVAPTTQNTISSLTDPTLNGWTAVALGTNSTTVGNAGRLNGNTFDTAQGAPIAGFAGGSSTGDFAVVGWSANIGSTWAEAQAWWANGAATGSQANPGWFGINTAVADNIPLANAGGPYPPIFGTTGGLITGWGMSYYAVPEPSTFALAGIGAAAMLIFRRRKA